MAEYIYKIRYKPTGLFFKNSSHGGQWHKQGTAYGSLHGVRIAKGTMVRKENLFGTTRGQKVPQNELDKLEIVKFEITEI